MTLAGLSTPYRTGTGYHITPVVGFIAPGFSLTLNPDEVADVFETPFEFLMDPVNHVQHEREIPDRDHPPVLRNDLGGSLHLGRDGGHVARAVRPPVTPRRWSDDVRETAATGLADAIRRRSR